MKTLLSFILLFSFQLIRAQSLDWVQSFGDNGIDTPGSVVVDDFGNVLVAGIFDGTVDFDAGTGVHEMTSNNIPGINFFLLKLDPTGQFMWVNQLSIFSNSDKIGITSNAVGEILLTGSFTDTVDFDPGIGVFNLISNGIFVEDAFTVKWNANGEFVWAKKQGSGNGIQGRSIATDISGNVYVAGDFRLTEDLDPGENEFILDAGDTGLWDIYITKLDADGNFVWAKRIGAVPNEDVNDIAIDAQGNLLLTGFFAGPVDFDPGDGVSELTTLQGSTPQMFVLKLTGDGEFVWAQALASTSIGKQDIEVDSENNVIVAQSFGGFSSFDFDPGPNVFPLTTLGSNDIAIVKFDSDGNFLWVKRMGGTQNDVITSLHVDHQNNIFSTGYFEGTCDFNPGTETFGLTPTPYYNSDAFVAKLDSDGNFLWADKLGSNQVEEGYSIYCDETGNAYVTGLYSGAADFDPGLATHYSTSNGNNDIFVVKLNQCMQTITDLTVTACESYDSPDGTSVYSNSGTYNVFLSDAAGCDSVISIHLTIAPPDPEISFENNTLISADSLATHQWIDCNNNNQPIDGETGQYFEPAVNGNYAVIVTQGECQVVSPCLDITLDRINEISAPDSFHAFPNPSCNLVTIEGEHIQGKMVYIKDHIGRLIESHTLNSTRVVLDISHLDHGVYFVEVDGNVERVVRK